MFNHERQVLFENETAPELTETKPQKPLKQGKRKKK